MLWDGSHHGVLAAPGSAREGGAAQRAKVLGEDFARAVGMREGVGVAPRCRQPAHCQVRGPGRAALRGQLVLDHVSELVRHDRMDRGVRHRAYARGEK
jgi:hypothetical protein